MRVIWAASVPIWMTFTGMSLLSEGCTWGVEDEMHWLELDGAWSGSPKPAATSWPTASA
jgi:hypothetical protein